MAAAVEYCPTRSKGTGVMKKASIKLFRRLLTLSLSLMLALMGVVVGTSAMAEEDASFAAALGNPTGTIRIGDSAFDPNDAVSTHWSDGEGWKNLPGKYVALVNYEGQGAEVSKDGGVLTLAVAGVNRIGTLKGNCSVNIVGSGIVLIDSIELGPQKTLSLMADNSLYEEGSAAVFLRQTDGSYLLINGTIPGILDEEYALDNVSLRIPKDSSLTFYTTGIRTETWQPEDAREPVTDVTLFTTDIPDDADQPVHHGEVQIKVASSKLTLGSNSTLTVDDGASILLREIRRQTLREPSRIESGIDVQGSLTIEGRLEGGNIDVKSGGSLLGTDSATLRSSSVNLNLGGNLSEDILLDGCSLTVAGPTDGTRRVISANIKDSTVYLKGRSIYVRDLRVAGTSRLGTDTNDRPFGVCELGNVTFSQGGRLEVCANDSSYWDSDLEDTPNLIEDCRLEISGTITGGTISVLAGCVEYTGTRTDTIPVVPDGYASRVLVTNLDVASTLDPLNMTGAEASKRVSADQIPVMECTVYHSLASEESLLRAWDLDGMCYLSPFERSEQVYTCKSFLALYGREYDDDFPFEAMFYPGVEVIYSDFVRDRFWISDERSTFSTENAILIRLIRCVSRGGQGGSSISHTETAFTGNGILGGVGDGSVTTGSGTVVYQQAGLSPTDPDDDPEDDPDDPEDPDDPDDPDGPDDEDERTSEDSGSGVDGKTTRPSGLGTTTNGELRPVVTYRGNGRYKLSVYRDGKSLDNLNGRTVTALVNNPEGVTDGYVCYAVFDDIGHGTWIPARYDPKTKGLTFETDRVGTFGIARVSVEDVTYPAAHTDAPIYRKMFVRIGSDEITDLPGSVAARMTLTPDEHGEAGLYAVFVDDDERMSAFPITSDKGSRGCRFDSNVTGNFVVVGLEGPFASDGELHDACKASEEVRILITLMRLSSFWS